ncbi:MAG: hypothetical protein SOV74_09910 [Coriobacteriales bacterium]|nr:hypothetical protein [Coriobacteriales bacterium]
MLDQITVFLENREGRLKALTRTLAEAQVNMMALTISETSDYGLVRIICDNPEKAVEALNAADFRVTKTRVSAVSVPNHPGGLVDLLQVLDDLGLNIEYGYCFSVNGDKAVDVLKITGAAEASRAAFALEQAGFKLLGLEDLL